MLTGDILYVFEACRRGECILWFQNTINIRKHKKLFFYCLDHKPFCPFWEDKKYLQNFISNFDVQYKESFWNISKNINFKVPVFFENNFGARARTAKFAKFLELNSLAYAWSTETCHFSKSAISLHPRGGGSVKGGRGREVVWEMSSW